MKPRLKYADVFPQLDFERMVIGTALSLDGSKVTFEGEHFGSIWIGVKRKVYFIREGDPVISRLRAQST